MDEAGLKWAAIADSDRPAAGAAVGPLASSMLTDRPATCLHLHVLDRTTPENYLDPAAIRAVTGIDCLVPLYGPLTTLGGTPLNKGELKAIKNASASIARQMGVAGLMQYSMDSTKKSEWVGLFEGIRLAFGM